MPELPEVETVMSGLRPALEGRSFTHVETRRGDLRVPFPKDFAMRLTGRRVVRLRRRAKYILVELDGGETLVIHLGMSGRMAVYAEGKERNAVSCLGMDVTGSNRDRSECVLIGEAKDPRTP